MATIKTDAELLAQVSAGIRVNGNKEITPPIHKSVEDNIIASKLNIKDGGNVIQALTGYTTELTLSDRKNFAYKGYIDDAIAAIPDPDLSAYYKKDGSNGPLTGNLDLGGYDLKGIGDMYDAFNVPTISPSGRALYDAAGNVIAVYQHKSTGFGIQTNNYPGYIKSDNLTNNKTYQLPDTSGTLALTSDIPTLSGIYKDTGVLTFAGLTYNSGTTVNIGAVTGQIVDNETTPSSPTYTTVTYAGATNVTVTTVGSGLASYVMLNSAGVISFQNTFPTNAERKTKIYLGKIGHPTGTITAAAVGNEPDFVLSPIAQIRSLYKAIGFVNNGVVSSANGANLNFNITAGTITHYASNFVTSRTIPNEIAISSGTPQSFLYRTQTGAGAGFITAIDPTSYDVAGTITAIPGSTNQATNQYIYCVPGLGFIVQYGQTIYSTLTDAIAAIGKEAFTVYPSLVNNAILIGVLSVQKGATALNNTSQARFFTADKFGQSAGSTAGISTSTLQNAYDNSLQPQITTSTTLGAVEIKRGSAADTDHVFDILNGAGSIKAFFTGEGRLTYTLDSAKMMVGNGSNVATPVSMSGDTTIDNAGATTISANAATYTKTYNGVQLAIVTAMKLLSGN